MNHWLVIPVVGPLLAAMLLLVIARRRYATQRVIGLAVVVALLAVNIHLLILAMDGSHRVYQVGAWPAPFGIVLVLDRLSALMLTLTSVVALFALADAVRGCDARGRNFHVLFQLQLMGLNGAFLTGDLFNLFVFFEVLLIASYGLLLHGSGAQRLRAGFHYASFNLAASSLFLIALAVIYSAVGTLNMADAASRMETLIGRDQLLAHIGALLLLVVFAAKAALLPLYLWLPRTYAAATAPVAALFSLMTKVGVYAILRVYSLDFGPRGGTAPLAAGGSAADWVLPAALLTLVAGTVGVVGARHLRRLTAYLVVVSVGIMLLGVGLFTQAGVQAALYYLVHSSVALAGLFLLAAHIAAQRELDDRLRYGQETAQPTLLGSLFFIAAVAVVGLPPLSGYLGKVLLLQAAQSQQWAAWIWTAVLLSSLLMLVAFSRAGSSLFWKTRRREAEAPSERMSWWAAMPVAGLLACSLALTVWAKPVIDFSASTAHQLLNPRDYIAAVLNTPSPIRPHEVASP